MLWDIESYLNLVFSIPVITASVRKGTSGYPGSPLSFHYHTLAERGKVASILPPHNIHNTMWWWLCDCWMLVKAQGTCWDTILLSRECLVTTGWSWKYKLPLWSPLTIQKEKCSLLPGRGWKSLSTQPCLKPRGEESIGELHFSLITVLSLGSQFDHCFQECIHFFLWCLPGMQQLMSKSFMPY